MNWFKKQELADAEFDIEGLEVFSIERNTKNETIIGYIRNGDEEEWTILTNLRCHNEMLRRLRNKLESKRTASNSTTAGAPDLEKPAIT